MADAPPHRNPADPRLTVLIPQLSELHDHYLALGIACAHRGSVSADITGRAGALRARSRHLRGEVARSRASRDVARRQTPQPVPLDRFSRQLAVLTCGSENVQDQQN